MADGVEQGLIAPHGGKLNPREVKGDAARALEDRAKSLPVRVLNSRELSDLELLANGGFSPLDGFMTQAQYKSVVDSMHLPGALPWSIPVTLSVSKDDANTIKSEVALADGEGNLLAVMTVEDTYEYDKQHEAQSVYRTTEDKHPGVAAVRPLRGGQATHRRVDAGNFQFARTSTRHKNCYTPRLCCKHQCRTVE